MSQMTIAEAQQISSLYVKLLSSKAAKIRTGIQRRAAMLADLGADADMSGNYRFEWLDAVSKEVIKVAAARGQEFNAAHPDDSATVQDLVDVFTRAIGLLKAASK